MPRRERLQVALAVPALVIAAVGATGLTAYATGTWDGDLTLTHDAGEVGAWTRIVQTTVPPGTPAADARRRMVRGGLACVWHASDGSGSGAGSDTLLACSKERHPPGRHQRFEWFAEFPVHGGRVTGDRVAMHVSPTP